MKKRMIFFAFLPIIVFSSCTRQENMNTDIFLKRLFETEEFSAVKEEKFNINGNDYVYFNHSGTNFVCEIKSDESENIKKICLAGNETDKAEIMKNYCRMIINVYAPQENAEEILSNLFNGTWDYHDTVWFRYSSVKSDYGLFFSIENRRYSTETDAELTLKQNDITRP